MKTFNILSIAVLTLALNACGPTTGDPTQGGLFGWSEDKAQQRQLDKRQELQNIEADTSDINRKNSSMQRKVNQSQSELNRY